MKKSLWFLLVWSLFYVAVASIFAGIFRTVDPELQGRYAIFHSLVAVTSLVLVAAMWRIWQDQKELRALSALKSFANMTTLQWQEKIDLFLAWYAMFVKRHNDALIELYRNGPRSPLGDTIPSDRLKQAFHVQEKELAYSYEKAEEEFLSWYDKARLVQKICPGLNLGERKWQAYALKEAVKTGTDG